MLSTLRNLFTKRAPLTTLPAIIKDIEVKDREIERIINVKDKEIGECNKQHQREINQWHEQHQREINRWHELYMMARKESSEERSRWDELFKVARKEWSEEHRWELNQWHELYKLERERYEGEKELRVQLVADLQRASLQELAARQEVHVRGAIELAVQRLLNRLKANQEDRKKLGGVQKKLDWALEHEENLKKCMEHVASVQNVRLVVVQDALHRLYQTLSKHVHGSEEVPTVRLQTYAQLDAVAMACVLAAANIPYKVTNEVDFDVTSFYQCPP